MNDAQKIRLLSRGLMAAMRWPYDGSMVNHVHDPSIPAKEGGFTDRYIADVNEIHAAWLVAKENQ